MQNVLLLSLAGAAGTLGRYAISELARRWLGARFPYGTLIVNVLGSLLLGFVLQLLLTRQGFPRPVRLALTVGFFGAFTTFSTFSIETLRYLEQGAWVPALSNVLLNVLLSLAAAWGGFVLGRAVLVG